jgi:triosephosphate isomerase (TIM)
MDYVLSSWKMYPTVEETESLFAAIQAGLRQRVDSGQSLPRVILCPPFLSLVPLRAMADRQVLALGAQNCHWEDAGPYTGEISARMLRGLADFVLIGHSERRAAGETDDQIARKLAAAVRNGIVPILLVGEEGRSEDAIHEAEHRLREGVSRVDLERQEVVVVYEPSWAIGKDETAPVDRIRRAVAQLKGVLAELGAREPKVIYGGSVDEDNVADLVRIDVLDGIGTGRASLEAGRFLSIIDRVAAGPA